MRFRMARFSRWLIIVLIFIFYIFTYFDEAISKTHGSGSLQCNSVGKVDVGRAPASSSPIALVRLCNQARFGAVPVPGSLKDGKIECQICSTK